MRQNKFNKWTPNSTFFIDFRNSHLVPWSMKMEIRSSVDYKGTNHTLHFHQLTQNFKFQQYIQKYLSKSQINLWFSLMVYLQITKIVQIPLKVSKAISLCKHFLFLQKRKKFRPVGSLNDHILIISEKKSWKRRQADENHSETKKMLAKRNCFRKVYCFCEIF